VSEQDISNDATPEAMANAVESAMAEPDAVSAEGSSSDASPEARGEIPSASSSDGPSGSSSPSSPTSSASSANLGGDVVMDALAGAARGQTLGKKQGMVSAGLGKKMGAGAMLAGTSALTGGLALGVGGLQVAGALIGAYTDQFRVRERGGQVQKMSAFAKGQGVAPATGGKIKQNGENLGSKASINKSHARNKGPQTDAERVLKAHGRKPKAGSPAAKSTGAALRSQSVQSPFANSRKAAVLGRYRSVQDKGHQGIQKDATYAAKAMGGKLQMHGVVGMRNDTQDALVARMTQLRPNQMRHQAPRPSF
jgi:hypothetical protein